MLHPDGTPWSVEDHLNNISYAGDPKYIPSDFALQFVNFIKLVNGGKGEEHMTPVTHYRMLDKVSSGKNRVLNLCHRGLSKTTLLAEYLFLYLAVYGELPGFGTVDLALYVSDSIDNGVKNMRKNLEFRWENSAFLKQYIPEIYFTDIRWEFRNVANQRLIVKGYGARTGVRGAKEMGKRPQLAVLDDLISDEDARSPTIISAVEDTVYKAVNYALHPTHNMMIWNGTPFNAKDPLYKAVASGAWEVNVFPVCEVFPCTEEEFRGSWPDRFNYAYVRDQYTKALNLGRVDTFNQELMLRILSEEDRVVTEGDLRWYSRQSLLANRGRFNFYITTDFATKEHQKADYSFISVWAYNHNGDWFWVDGVCARQTMDKTLNDLFRMVQKYKPQQVGVEVNGQQGAFINWIQEQMMNRNIFFSLASYNNGNRPGVKSGGTKLERFNVMLPLFKMGKIYFPNEGRTEPALAELQLELSQITVGGFKSRNDDGIDTVSQLGCLTPWKPSEESGGVPGDRYEDMWEIPDNQGTVSRMNSYIV